MWKLAQFTDVFSFSLQIRGITGFFQVICSVFFNRALTWASSEMECFARELDYLYS